MVSVGIRELKNKLSAYLRRVRAGERVLITDRSVVVAELVPPQSGGERRYPGLEALIAAGRITRASENLSEAYPSLTRIAGDGTATRLLDEERGEDER
ncbi:MAG: type II toxin-antitoxin system prevent-host-death family antitoxin [bacterium]